MLVADEPVCVLSRAYNLATHLSQYETILKFYCDFFTSYNLKKKDNFNTALFFVIFIPSLNSDKKSSRVMMVQVPKVIFQVANRVFSKMSATETISSPTNGFRKILIGDNKFHLLASYPSKQSISNATLNITAAVASLTTNEFIIPAITNICMKTILT